MKPGDQALIWRAGKQASFVGWGVFLSEPRHYDLSSARDPFWKTSVPTRPGENYAPLRVWPAGEIAKADVSGILPKHRIVTAPMGTVFPLDSNEVAALQPLLTLHGYDLGRPVDVEFKPPPVIPGAEPTPGEPAPRAAVAKITPALFLLSLSPERPTEITIEGDALRLLLAERAAIATLDGSWDSVGVYVLIGKPTTDGAILSVYTGKAQNLRSRIKTGHGLKTWTRCLLIQRPGLHPFNASDISWLERRLIDVLLEAPEFDLINKIPPPAESVPDYKAEILERTVVATRRTRGVRRLHRLTRRLLVPCAHEMKFSAVLRRRWLLRMSGARQCVSR